MIDGKMAFITDSVHPVINNGGKTADLTLVPVQQVAVPVQAPGRVASGVSPAPTASAPIIY